MEAAAIRGNSSTSERALAGIWTVSAKESSGQSRCRRAGEGRLGGGGGGGKQEGLWATTEKFQSAVLMCIFCSLWLEA